MIYFLTKRNAHVIDNRVTVLSNFDLLHEKLEKEEELGLDKEFNGLNEIYAIPLLTTIGTIRDQFVIDDTSMDLTELRRYENRRILGHNLKIDIKVARKQGLNFRNLYDTMITEQRLGMDSGRSNTLEATYLRRCGKPMPLGKDLRNEFTEMDKNSLFRTDHILYAAGDIFAPFEIKEVQLRFIGKFNYFKLLMGIEFPLIPLLADAELEGFHIDSTLWRENIEKNKKESYRLQREMDRELINLGAVKFREERKIQEVVQTSLFPDVVEDKEKVNPNKNKINYNSPAQVKNVFSILELPIPSSKTTRIDKITKKKIVSIEEGVGKEALQPYLLKYPNTKLKTFIEKFLEYKGIEKRLSSFGNNFLVSKVGKDKPGYKNAITGKVHTIYRQCMSKTGRLQSGDSKIGFYNSQQIPAEKEYRIPFCLTQEEIDNDWWITTADLVGAEAVIMCALAKDKQLYKWAVEEDDLHSPMSTKCFRALYAYRKRLNRSLIIKDSKNKEYLLTENFTIDKKNNTQLRTDFKPVTFGVVYGAGGKTVGVTINLPEDEGQLIVDTICNTIPDTIKMVEGFSKMAIDNGYVISNRRTNSRKYFQALYRGNKVSREELVTIQQEARNYPIQGTQADLIKEAMVQIDKEFKARGIENCLLLQVHDELVWKHKGRENGQIIMETMGRVGTLYLEGFTVMKASGHTEHHWIK
jgi:DNA polymerase-1